MWPYGLLAVPVLSAVLALATGRLVFRSATSGLCAAILLLGVPGVVGPNQAVLLVVAALSWSLVGDAFLSTRGGRTGQFILGILSFLLAHVAFTAFALTQGRLARPVLGLLLAGYLAYYVLKLRPTIHDRALAAAALAYLVVSCVALAAAAGARVLGAGRWFYVAGIALIVFSDTLISFREFLAYRAWDRWILPTYYLAHISITLGVLVGIPPTGSG